jgi:transcription elongation GreA/GreB family factor
MMASTGFNLGIREAELLRSKLRNIQKSDFLKTDNIAAIGSRVTVIDCLDSSIVTFRLVESTDTQQSDPSDVPIASPLGLALLGTSPGSKIKMSIGDEQSQTIVLKVIKE